MLRRSVRARRGAVAFTFAWMVISGPLLFATPSVAVDHRPVELVRTYSSNDGEVFEVCRGTYDPPVTDPFNPAYCRGDVERWSLRQWQAYNTQGTVPGEAEGNGKKGGQKGKGTPGKGGVKVAVGGTAGEAAMPVTSYGGSLDPTTVLGLENPLCGERRSLSPAQVRNCHASQSPEAAYPVGNYGWDIHLEEGGFITALLAPAVSVVILLFSIIWLISLFVLKGCLIILGFAFSLSPFTDNSMLRDISKGLETFFQNFTSPWIKTLLVILGIWGLYQGLIRRRAGETFGGMLLAVVMMLVAMWIIHAPGETVGRLAGIINKTSLVAVSAPTSGNARTPLRSYNDAMAKVWNQMTAVPFCALNFSDVHWCMNAKPSADALKAAEGGLDVGDAYTRQLLEDLPEDEDQANRVLERHLAALFGRAPTIRDLYLRFSPQSGPRDALWDYYHGKSDNHVGLPLNVGPQLNIGGGSEGVAPEKVEMQGRGGLLTRMVLVIVFALGMLGGLLLLLWIAMKLVMAAAASFVLVLATPLAMFFPVFGQAGRAAFVRWGTSLIGAIVAKLIFSGLLGIVLLGSSVLGSGVGGSSPTLGLLAVMAFWWAVLLSRERYLSLLQIEPIRDDGGSVARTMAGGYVGYRVAKAAKQAISRRRGEREERTRHREDERTHERREAADSDLTEQAEQRLNVATSNAQQRDAHFSGLEGDVKRLRSDPDVQALRRDPSQLDEEQHHYAERKAAELRQMEEEGSQLRPQAMADRQLLNRVRSNDAAGLPRHSRSEIAGARDAIRREARLPDDAPEHRWRAEAVGKEPSSAEGRQAIADSLARSRAATGAMPGERLTQVDLHRLRQLPDSQRRPTGGIRKARPTAPAAGSDDGTDIGGQAPKSKRRSRAREWMSR